MKLRLSKCTQYKKDAILWQVSPLSRTSDLPDKFYLVLSHHKEGSQYLRFTRERPTLTFEASGAFASLVRKYMSSAVIEEVLVDEARRNIWIPLLSAGQEWFIHIHHEGAVSISLISPTRESLVRMGMSGLFTKKKSDIAIPSRSELQDRMSDFLSTLSLQASQKPTVHKESAQNEGPTFSRYQREARRRLARRLKTVRQSFAKLQDELSSTHDSDRLEREARLLQSYLYKVHAQMSELILSPEETGEYESVTIVLDADKSPSENLAYAFSRIKKLKTGFKTLSEQVAKVGTELDAMEQQNSRLQSIALSEDDIAQVLRRFRLPVEKPEASHVSDDKTTLPYRIYYSGKFEILVGKGPRENDELTKSARSNDYWFHAIGLGGSHIIVPYQQLGKEGLTAKVKRDAAILALHFSRVRKDLSGEVYVTQRRCITKKKGMPPGLWLVQQSETLFLNYSESELKGILDKDKPS